MSIDETRLRDAMTEHGVPEGMHQTMVDYIINRIPPGGFLTAVLSNDLMEAFGRADEENRATMYAWCMVIYNDIPSGAWGSREKVSKWLGAE